MLFKEFAEHLEKLEKISSRLTITDEVASLLKKLSVTEVEGGVYLLMGRLAPAYTGLEFNLGWKMILRAVSQVSGRGIDEILVEFKHKGDIGEVVNGLRPGVFWGKQLTVGQVYERLMKIAKYGGAGSQEEKISGLADLFRDLSQTEAKFISRMIMGHLRLGFSEKTIFDALSVVGKGDKSARKKLDEVYQILPDVGLLAKTVLEKGLDKALANPQVKVGVPVVSALCQRLNQASEIIEKMKDVAVERKYDGTRVQIHFRRKGFADGSQVKTFTRNLEETSQMFPELAGMAEWIKGDEVVLDSEAVGIDPKTGKIMPFQATITRKRKHGIKEALAAVPLRFFLFDILSKDGATLINEPYYQRRNILVETIKKNNIVVVDENYQTKEAKVLHGYHEQFLQEGFEGAVIKKWDGNYLPGRQGWNWVKIKEKEGSTGKLADTLDLVVMGFYRGKGKRSDFGVGAFLVGITSGERVLTIAKIGTGLTDEQFRELKNRLDDLTVKEKPRGYEVQKSLEADVWVRPKLIVEIAADELTKSPNHSAGVALRFPRLIKFRDDKDLAGATTLKEMGSMRK